MPKSCTGVPDEILNPQKSWTGTADFKEEVTKLGGLFVENFKKFSDEATPEVIKAGEHFQAPSHVDKADFGISRSPSIEGTCRLPLAFPPRTVYKVWRHLRHTSIGLDMVHIG